MKRIALIAAAAACVGLQVSAQEAGFGADDLARIDTNRDGAVTREEFDVFAARAFDLMDANRDRMLSPAETEGHVAEGAFADTDADGDGAVSRQEFGRRMYADFAEADQDGDGILN